ncbi:MAG: hypothetical protein K1W16_14775 [Lachnospiraceae bacterium]|jgi:hypothetical protein
MQLIKEDEGIKLFKNEDKFYLSYDAGAHMINKKRIEISLDEAEICQYVDGEMYNTILKYQNNGVYGEDV